MSKIFSFLDWVSSFIEGAINFIKQLWHIVTTVPPIIWTLFDSIPLVLKSFFIIFLNVAIILFVWRLIP